ncbi:MAG: response regulator, partial [Gammaproteobacteria bacterium]|nr:response regulator [Gammaproteobacteria bacterium]
MTSRPPKSRPDPVPAPDTSPDTGDGGLAESRLLANVSHEMRTPMDAILGYAELLGETPLSDTQQTFVDAIERAARGLLDIMDDVLNLSRMEAGKLVIHTQPFSIRDCTDSVAQLLAPSAYRKGLDFIQLTDFDVPASFIGDPLRIRQILVNLVGNAIKFTQTGGVRLRVSAHQANEQQFELIMQFTDTGIGIDSEDISKLFEPFSQPAKPQGDIAGTGLGLVISKNLCEAMGGRIEVRSTPGTGSTFCVRIPLEPVEELPQTREGPDLLAGRNIVVAGSDPVQAAWIAENLRLDGARTRVVPNLKQLADAVSSGQSADEVAVSIITARDLVMIEKTEQDWRPARDHLPVLSLVSTVSGHALRQVSDALPGDAIPAQSTPVTVTRHLATMLQQHELNLHDSAAKTSPKPQPLAGLYLLVAEDNQFGRDYLQMLLSRHGATVDVCRDGLDACRMMRDHEYDLVLMDVRMPQCDGIEAMRMLSRTGTTLPPVIGLTAAPEECFRAMNAGMTDCLLKPIRPALLLRYIVDHRSKKAPGPANPLSFIDAEMRDELNRELPQRGDNLLRAIKSGDMNLALEMAHKINGTAA